MAHHTLQNIPVQEGSNRPVSPSARFISTASPIKRHVMPYPVHPISPCRPTGQQPAIFAPLSNNSTLPWSHSVSDASVEEAMALGRPHGQTIYRYGTPAHFQSPLVNINSMMVQPNVFGQGSFRAPELPSTGQVLTPTPTPNVIHLDQDGNDDELPDPLDLIRPIDAGVEFPKETPFPIEEEIQLPERSFEISLNLYQQQPTNTDSVGNRTKKARGRAAKEAPKAAKPQWKNFKPSPVKSVLPVGSFTWPVYRKKIFDTCNVRLAGISNALIAAEKTGLLAIQAFINATDRQHKAYHSFITDDASLGKFVTAVLAAPPEAIMGFKITHTNPKTSEDANRALASTFPPPNHPSDSPSDEEDTVSEGVSCLIYHLFDFIEIPVTNLCFVLITVILSLCR
ncbi:uncharacterized protein MELLADRAFT_85182 [Melampsora larici-populina 98AG31]|uniref:Uncharacterized protein n=1 Tax=Melampsora larici-populina (strain 98AG31 / pathotype 3-4-7) TaxID=747676 RepID=F4RHT5_MELLP|nr:uncharacterized protein MELLADRAFT_85182 [Melampsora larici-populina 98AG31]EGG08080.1 hypothetical protein MELLADRAFT_85182 [Melampsora larici-populina 98AG31]